MYGEDFGGCLRYSNDRLGSVWKFGRFIGIFGSLLAWMVFGAMMLASCFKYPNPKICFPILGICMGIMSLFSFLLLVGLANKSETFPSSNENDVSSWVPKNIENDLYLSAGGVLAIFSGFVWAFGAGSIIVCMNERILVPVPTRPVSRNAGPSYAATLTATNDVIIEDEIQEMDVAIRSYVEDNDVPIQRNTGNEVGQSHPPTFTTANVPVDDDDNEDIDVMNDVVSHDPDDESPFVDTQVERITDLNGNETVITTTTTFLSDGTRRVVKTIETVEEAE